ncbi:hypothetical protein SAMN05443634_105145 [Chishuiella changwenlii]|uniref:Uncharacterized protein n=1 Tax=Chishuiella changwenlii TaxID=1434701 RepID=A0A1M6X7Q6_9FLAO|nr:hypothetical protein [Chishuiella changwenlii]SHL01953.1 hypothetical protein SAMN05443634_105145 [Chishuiella changwenlii]
MQNGFNYRIAMLISLLIVFCLSSCRTSKKSIEKSRIEFEKNEVKKNNVDSSVLIQKDDALNKVDSLSWSNYMKELNFSFNGVNNNDELEIIKTDNGWKFKGKGFINGKSTDKKNDSIIKSNTHQVKNEVSKVNSRSKTELESNNSQITVDKEKDKFSIGPTFGVLILALIIILYYVIRRFKY